MAYLQETVNMLKKIPIENQEIVINSLKESIKEHNQPENNSPSEIENGTKKWRNKKGQLHRTGIDVNGLTQPAVIRSNGTKEWWKHGRPSRTDAIKGMLQPAIVDKHGNKQYWVNGIFIACKYNDQN